MIWTGGCLCGALRFQAEGDPTAVGSCHCINCRKMTGAAFATFALFPRSTFTWLQGQGATYAASADLVRQFCPRCGGTVTAWRESEKADWIFIWAGSLDKAEALKPSHHIFAKDELPWLHLDDALPRYDLFSEDLLADLGLDSRLRNAGAAD